jgi:hypothetical protein
LSTGSKPETRPRPRRAWCTLGAVALAAALLPPPGPARAAAFFGDLHAHSSLSDDATNPPDAFFRVARDVAGLDFVVLSDHDAFLTENEWAILKTTAASFHLPGRFVTFPAIEWTHRWHMNVYFQRDDESYCTSQGCPEAADFYAFYGARIRDGEAAAHVNHPADLFKVTWDEIDDELTNAVEVWNTAGAGDNEPGFGNALWALRAGFRLGLVGVSDDHHSERDLPLLGTGLTGCPAAALTREDLLAALRDRRCWATSGERIELALDVGGEPMGGELAAALGSQVPVRVDVLATRAPVVVELLRNGDVVRRVRCASTDCTLSASVAIAEPHTFLYARVGQAGGARAWSSPVWVRGGCASGGDSCLASRLAPGGGDPADDCLTEWLLPPATGLAGFARARGRVRCADGDRACDVGGEPGECTVRLGLCFGVRDPRVAGCTPAAPDAFEVVLPAASADRETPEFQNRATLSAAFHASADGDATPRCSAPNDLRVPLGVHVVEIVSRAGARVDRDRLELECLPGRATRRLPRVARPAEARAVHRHEGDAP